MANLQHTPEPCPSTDALAELLSRTAEAGLVASIRQHLTGCGSCRRALAAAGDADTEGPLFLQPGSKLGRYAIEDVVGVGGMGIVYTAHDTALDRRVALKVLRPFSETTEDDRVVLVREAQAMAQLSHPNVVTVFDVGEAGSFFYLAMEFIAGGSLAEWLAQGPGGREVMQAFLAAGRGLAAAHGAGIIHGDFKPSNVLVGVDGGVRVTDFGLALRATEEPFETSGACGTPRYLAPERKRGEGLSVVSDVYSYCASLREALTHGGQEPAALSSALRHGLALDPKERARNLDEILATLESVVEPRPRRLRALWWAAGGLAVTALAVASWASNDPGDPCAGAELEFQGVWNPDRSSAMTGSGRVRMQLDAYASAWTSTRLEACEATLVRHEVSADTMVRRLQCLEGRKQAFDAVVEALETPGSVQPQNVVIMTAELPALSLCTDDRYVSAAVSPPADSATVARVERVRSELARARAMLDVPDHETARRLATDALEVARQLSYEPVLVEALDTSALVFTAQGDYDAALADANAAYERADAAARSTAADVHRHLARIHQKRGDYDAALREAHKSLSIASKAFGDEHPAVAPYHLAVGTALEGHGRWADAIAAFDRGLEVRGRDSAADDLLAATLYNNIGAAHFGQGNGQDALVAFRGALELRERHLGPDHLTVASSRNNIGGALHTLGRYEEALLELRLALAIREGALAPGHPKIADVRLNVAAILYEIGDWDAALTEYREVLAISEAALGRAHPDVAFTHSNIGAVLHRLGDHQGALAELREALTDLRGSLGPAHPRVAVVQVNLGTMLTEMGRPQEGLDELREAQVLYADVLSVDHPSMVSLRLNIGVSLRALGREEEALHELEGALALARNGQGEEPVSVAPIHMNLGVTLHLLGRHDEALEQFRRAHALQREGLPPEHLELAESAAAIVFAATMAGSSDAVPPALAALDDVITRRPGDLMLPALRRMVDIIKDPKKRFGRADIAAVEAAREIIAEQGNTHFVSIADAWLAEHAS